MDVLARDSRRLRERIGPRVASAALALLIAAPSGAAPAWRFTDVTAASGLRYDHQLGQPSGEIGQVVGGVAAGDYDRDGWVDLFVTNGGGGAQHLFRNRGDGTFEDVASVAGVSLPGFVGAGAAFADLDGDGWVDLLVLGELESANVLFRNRRDGTFEDVTDVSGIAAAGPSISAAFGDYDSDGDLDVFITHWGTFFTAAGTGFLWRNEGAMRFVDVTAEAGITTFISAEFPGMLRDNSFTPNFADVDDDGRPDLLVAADFGASRVLLNNGDGTFRNATTSVISDENGMGAAVGDYDNDGDLDWFVSSIWDPNGVAERHWGVSGNRLYRNDGGGRFSDVTDLAAVRAGYWGWGSTFADLDNDGDLDLFHVNGFGDAWDEATVEFTKDPARLFVSNGDGTFVERSSELGAADIGQGRGVVAFDYDRDGDIDLFIANNRQAPVLLRNDGGNDARWLDVELVGAAPNTNAIGARIRISVGDGRQMRELRAGSNFESQDPANAHFGVGSAKTVDLLDVSFPSGARARRFGIATNQRVRIAEPETTGADCRSAADNQCSPALGSAKSVECYAEWRVSPTPPRDRRAIPGNHVACINGEPGCDLDGDDANDGCAFELAVCVNNRDPRLPSCTPEGVKSATILAPNPERLKDATDRQHCLALRRALDSVDLRDTHDGSELDRCSPGEIVHVPLRRTVTGRLKAGRRHLRIRVVGPSGRTDVDALHLECRPAEVHAPVQR